MFACFKKTYGKKWICILSYTLHKFGIFSFFSGHLYMYIVSRVKSKPFISKILQSRKYDLIILTLSSLYFQ